MCPVAAYYSNVPRIYGSFILGALLGALACGPAASDDNQQGSDNTTGAAPEGGAGGAGSGGAAATAGIAGTATAIDCSAPDVAVSPLRRLTREQYDNALRDLLHSTGHPSVAVAPDEKITQFYSNAISPMTRLGVEQYSQAAEDIARTASADINTLVTCDRAQLGDAACATQFIATFGRRAFRRPLSEPELARYQVLFDAHVTAGFAEGIRLVVLAMLQSPHFLYHVEPPANATAGLVPLDTFQLASRLSFALWNSIPDDALLDAAASNQLDSKDGVLTEAMRLLDDARANDALTSFHSQWLGLEHWTDIQKDSTLFPQFDAALKTAMADETFRFVEHVIRQGDGRLETLLSAPFTVADPALYAFYGDVTPAADGTLPLDPTQRAGLLTQPAFLATHAHANQTSPVHRGLAVRKSLLCTPLPDPPPNVSNVPPSPAPDATTRQRFAAHATDPSCAACHQLMDPIGVGFENYDAIGQYRSAENGAPIDASGELLQAGSASGAFVGAVELAHKLAASDEVRACVQKQWFRFSLGRTERTEDTCSMNDVAAQFAASDYNVKTLLLALVSSDAFRYQKVEP